MVNLFVNVSKKYIKNLPSFLFVCTNIYCILLLWPELCGPIVDYILVLFEEGDHIYLVLLGSFSGVGSGWGGGAIAISGLKFIIYEEAFLFNDFLYVL